MTALYWSWRFAAFVFLPLPIAIVVISSFSATGYLQFPPAALSWRWYVEFLENPAWMTAMGVSTVIALMSATIVTTLAFLAAFARTRLQLPGTAALDLLMISPLLLPNVAVALSLWMVLTKLGWLGSYPGILLTHTIVCFPFAYRPLMNAMRQLDLSLEEAALSLGAHPSLVFRVITLPLLRPGLIAAFLFSFIISFDEVSVTLFLVGPNVTTLPVRIYTEIQESGSPVVAAISSFLVAITIIIFLVADRLVGARMFIAGDRGR